MRRFFGGSGGAMSSRMAFKMLAASLRVRSTFLTLPHGRTILLHMARPLRIEYPGAVYHVTSRGNERKVIFKDAADREAFLSILAQVNKRYHWLCHAYCLMNNHYHLLIETPDGNLSLGMRQLNGVYTQLFNRRKLDEASISNVMMSPVRVTSPRNE